jgi:OOP family OmpA-OmpF porin
MKNLLLLFFLFFICTAVFAQYTATKDLADKAFENKNYYEAASYYKKLVTGKHGQQMAVPFYSNGKTTKKQIQAEHLLIYYQLAESYRLYQDFTDAAEWYGKVLKENQDSDYPLAGLWYGVCLRANQQFDDAIKQLQLFISSYKGSKDFMDLAKRELANCLFAKEQYQHPAPVVVTKMDGKWNADAGDYAFVQNKESYWFTSSRLAVPNKKHLNHIYTVASKDSSPVIVNYKLDNDEKDVEYGTPSLDASCRHLYLTRWYKDDDKTVLEIYCSVFENNKWSDLQKLNNKVNADGYNALQPYVTPDGKRLFFASDKPGGQGGYDIWVSELDDAGSPINAVNAGKSVNSPLDEESPYYDVASLRLVYASKGFVGLGGFDLFESYLNNGQWSVPANLGYPINSSKDDLYYTSSPADPGTFYISSDRLSQCCLNLFQGKYKKSFIEGLVIDCSTMQALPGVKVSLIDSATKKTLNQLETGPDAKYKFEAEPKHPYKLVFEKNGYFTKTVPVLIKPRIDTLVNPNVCLQDYKIDKPITIKNILYDFNKADLRPESKIALDALVVTMQDNPNIKIELASHTDSIGKEAYNLKLSQQRAQSCVDYIISKGVSKDRIVAKGYGKSRPLMPNSLPDGKDNPEGRQLNRRTEFTVKR